jgi:hypothetical protein
LKKHTFCAIISCITIMDDIKERGDESVFSEPEHGSVLDQSREPVLLEPIEEEDFDILDIVRKRAAMAAHDEPEEKVAVDNEGSCLDDIRAGPGLPPALLRRGNQLAPDTAGPGAFRMGGDRDRESDPNQESSTTFEHDASANYESLHGEEPFHTHAELAEETTETQVSDPALSETLRLQPPIDNCSQQLPLFEGLPVHDDPETCGGLSKRFFISSMVAILILLSVIILLSLGLSGAFESEVEDSNIGMPTEVEDSSVAAPYQGQSMSTLERIQQRGYLMAAYPTFGYPVGNITGRNADLVRTIAAAIFGEPKVEFIKVGPLQSMYELLVNGTVDIILSSFTHSMEREVYLVRYS